MAPVITNKGQYLRSVLGPLCGNGVVEEGEECDSGCTSLCKLDSCCHPPSAPTGTHGCQLKEGKACSSIFPCCTASCDIIPVSVGKICQTATDCSLVSVCDGITAKCSQAQLRPDGTPCSNLADKGTCLQGRYVATFCEYMGLCQCQCSANTFHSQRLCEMCDCPERPGETCVPLSVLGVYHNDGSTVYLGTGQPCNSYKGNCSVQHYCTSMDHDGAIYQVKNPFQHSSSNIPQRGWPPIGIWYYWVSQP